MRERIGALLLATFALVSSAAAGQGPIPQGVPLLDHVFLIVLENHGYAQIIGNPNAPFINGFAGGGNRASNYFAVGHPSLTNYLELVGGSNFGVLSDNAPAWHDSSCATNLGTGQPNTTGSAAVCPIRGSGTDAATPGGGGAGSIAATGNTLGITIADQLATAHRSWKTYQESLPPAGADRVDFSDGVYVDSTDFGALEPTLEPLLSSADLARLYAVKHDPFVYFAAVQGGADARLGLAQVAPFDGPHGLDADLASGKAPSFSFIVPNQCDDQHGLGNAGRFCQPDAAGAGEAGLNPALIQRGDSTVRRVVTAIESSKTWRRGRNAILLLWDESFDDGDDRVLFAVMTSYGVHGVESDVRYTHFSTLKTIEAAFGLPCLNHACDGDVRVMSDLFAPR